MLSLDEVLGLRADPLYRNKTERVVTVWQDVNRYGYNAYGLWIPHALASLFSSTMVVTGIAAFVTHGAKPGIKFQDVMGAVERKEIRVQPEPARENVELAERARIT
jgi:hypothetical protein